MRTLKRTMKRAVLGWGLMAVVLAVLCTGSALAQDNWVVYDGFEGPGNGKHIVFVTGDEEYRSEESMPQMAKILAKNHGFKSTVLFAINKETGEIDPETLDNIPGLEALDSADLMVLFIRFRELPDDQMKRIIDYVESGKPIVALRTSSHAFNYDKNKDSPYAKYSFDEGLRNDDFPGGFGRQILGETWVDHYGDHGSESTRGIVAEGMEGHPIVQGCEDIWGPGDLYAVNELSGDSQPIVMGQVLSGMSPDDGPNTDRAPIPLAWIKSHTGAAGNPSRIFMTTSGHGDDFQSEGFRRLLINASYWGMGMEDQIESRSNADLVGEYDPTPVAGERGAHKKGVKPADHKL